MLMLDLVPRRLIPLVISALASVAVFWTVPAHSATITIDAPGCTAGGTMTWDAANKTVYCQGASKTPASILNVRGPDCVSGSAMGWNAATLRASCVASTGATPAAALQIGVSLPDCVGGSVTWNAATSTLTCKLVFQTLNVDGSTSTVYDSLTDGLIIMRYLFGIRGPAMTANALGATATRTDPAAIAAYLDSIRTSLDIDNNGVVDALTDGALIMRYLFGSRGDALVKGAVGGGAVPGTAAAIEAKLQSLIP